ncbi:hypothetical protein FEM48_Zijuj01G0214300 [Ziziphus jujuba var. spinosa]|uniref:Apple domain-containing protein n=1 Tax=Ziziphus jujuba var. spinosa TaxID=714518 RepID=A0A978W3N2_ZIZJJ|nr:hypothetical protein FEM48_Zijuj01G0214300 [Ziziphus jujuba var. spinosa]
MEALCGPQNLWNSLNQLSMRTWDVSTDYSFCNTTNFFHLCEMSRGTFEKMVEMGVKDSNFTNHVDWQNINENPVCECLQGFKPTSQGNWNIMDWSQGCERNVPLNCQEKHSDGFVKFVGVKLPDTTFTWVNKSMNLQECRAKCLNNCSCMAFANSDISGKGSGCVHWFGGLVDIRGFPEGGQDLHIRMPASELEKYRKTRGDDKVKKALIAVAVVGVVSGILFLGFYIRRSRRAALKAWGSVMCSLHYENSNCTQLTCIHDNSYLMHAYLFFHRWDNHIRNGSSIRSTEMGTFGKDNAKYYRTGPWNGLRFSGAPELKPNPLFSFHFVYNDDEVYYTYSLLNKSVISRIVLNQTTSVRERTIWIEAERTWKQYSSVPRDYCDTYRLCGANGKCIIGQNPVCQCLQGFKPKSQGNWNTMDWSHGCERNVPLNCQEKQSDGFVKFVGLKLPDATLTWVNKKKYRKAKGDSKVKKAVIAVAVIGVVSGILFLGFYIRRSRKAALRDEKQSRDLKLLDKDMTLGSDLAWQESCESSRPGIRYSPSGFPLMRIFHIAWTLMQEGRPIELIDAWMSDYSQNLSEILRCIHVSLLCVQQRPMDRPCMSSVVLMLSSEGALPEPKTPGYFMEADLHLTETDSPSSKFVTSSTNDMSITVMEAR